MTTQFTDHETWFTGLPSVVVSAAALITSTAGWPLLVKPNYRDHWSLPGGICEHGEPPHVGCAREVLEEIGLPVQPGRLLAIDWAQPLGPELRPMLSFVFDGGTLADGSGIVLQVEELDDWQFADPAELARCLPPYQRRRVRGGLDARAAGTVAYLPRA
ncbi:MAG: NUDIX domain-containing protein [Streptosporangiaceae bacterium]